MVRDPVCSSHYICHDTMCMVQKGTGGSRRERRRGDSVYERVAGSGKGGSIGESERVGMMRWKFSFVYNKTGNQCMDLRRWATHLGHWHK